MIKKYLSFVMLFVASSFVFGQATLSYDKGTGVNGGITASVTYPELSTCQTSVSVVGNSGIWNGVVWSNGTFNVIVNGTNIGNYPTGTNVSLNAYLPITSLQLTSTAGTWHTVGGVVTVVTPGTLGAPTTADVVYNVGDVTTPLSATLTGAGTTLKWYTTVTGGGYSATAPTPSSASAGITNYWVSQADASGCESARVKVKVYVGTQNLPYHGGAGVNGGTTASTTLSNLSGCQLEVYVDGAAGIWNGVVWSSGTFNLTVNGTAVGSYPNGTQVDLTSYIPVTSVQLTSNAGTWHTVDATVHVVSLASSTPVAPTVATVYYAQNQTASPLTATLTGTGTTLKWYTSANGDNYSATAPTPSTSALGTTSYWVAQADASGCESERSEIMVVVAHAASYLSFDGINDEVLVPAETINDLPAATIETWVYLNSIGTDQSIFTKQSNFENTYVNFQVMADGSIHYKSKNSAGQISSNTLLVADQWYHIALSFDGASANLYIDGTLDASANGDFSIPYDVTITGASFGSVYTNGNYLDGNIDEFRVWDSMLDETTINRRMNCEVDGASAGLVAYYNFNTGIDAANNALFTTLADQTANGHDGTLMNFALAATTSNWLYASPVTSGVLVPEMPIVTAGLTYCFNETANQLSAAGTSLVWYTAQVGGAGDVMAPTPATNAAGMTSYWVASSNSNGCESDRSEIQVTVLSQITGTDVQSACNSYDWIDGNTYTSSNNTATYLVVGGAENGCDSLVTLNLTVNVPTTGTDVQTACDSYTWIDGITYISNENLATFTLTNAAGCDSIVTLNLTINATPTATAVDNGDATITGAGTGNYQWVDCNNNNAPIANATSALFAPTANGSYAVTVSSNGCSNTSDCVVITTVGLNELQLASNITLVPNPGTDWVTIVTNEQVERAAVYTASGSLIEQHTSTTFNVEGYAPGVYFIKVSTTSNQEVIRFVKQ